VRWPARSGRAAGGVSQGVHADDCAGITAAASARSWATRRFGAGAEGAIWEALRAQRAPEW
jgi:hypothetical protein